MPSPPRPIVKIATPGPFAEALDYLDPAGTAQPGCRVEIPLGRRRVVGVVLQRASSSDLEAGRLRQISALIDDQPLLDAALLKLLLWVSDYYQHPIGDTLANALPGMLKRGADITAGSTRWRLTPTCRGVEASALAAELKRAPRQLELLQFLLDADPAAGLSEDQLAEHPQWRQPLQRLIERDWVRAEFEPWQPAAAAAAPGPALNEEQSAAVYSMLDSSGFATHLLQGVTGSGKTEVYLELIRQRCAERQTLVLVPEIGLTPQLVARFARLGLPLVTLHSGMLESERRRAWAAARSGQARIVIGTRSAVFTPLPEAGLIIVDEEHDGSLKQQEGLRYHARDVAIRRAQFEGLPIVLGSATPALESIANARAGRSMQIFLNKRAGAGRPPTTRLIDLRSEPVRSGMSPPLIQAMDRHLQAGGQVMLFLNRRGFAPALLCHECSWTADCRRCDAKLTLHARSERLICHHCGAQSGIPLNCPECKSEDLIAAGQGTERLEEKVATLFPDQALVRLDRDSMRRRGSLEAALQSIRDGEARIMIGTQMLAKGHDFPNVTLAAVINADGGLFAVDFRAAERMAQLIVQVSGRAGRGEKAGEVLIQTHQPEHPLLQSLVTSGYSGFAETALREREEYRLPPYSFLAVLRAEATAEAAGRSFLQTAVKVADRCRPEGMALWGPAPAPMFRRAGRYRYQLLVNAPQRPRLQQFLKQWLPQLRALPQSRKVRWSVDVDPLDLY